VSDKSTPAAGAPTTTPPASTASTTTTTTTTTTAPPTKKTPPMTLPQLHLPSLKKKEQPPRARVFALVDPDGAFVAAMRRPLVVASLVVAALFAVLPPVAFLANAARGEGVVAVLKDELHKSGRLEKLNAQQREGLEKVAVPFMTVALPAGAVVKRELWILYCALVCLAFLKGTRPQMNFHNVVAVAVVGAAPWFVHDVVAAVAFSVFDLHGIDPQNPVASNPAAWLFAGKDSRGPLAVFLRGLDFFDLWGCFWMTAGLTRVAGGRTSLPAVVVFGGHFAAVVKDMAAAAAANAAG
jgi:hypothetical protein